MIMQAKALFEALQFSRSAVTSVDWKSYPILTFPDAPEVVMDLIFWITECRARGGCR